ncbi:MAG: uncharacterized protein KVP18_004062 [Porospora cf. gigantea A]|uniref:uncharacterized protein n=1 Tax=Porospora cf. gigantea A TaxID=2853593 RepID=UPI00355A7E08|nr:MAG: hypothetical protein KVP18_004062 [Porospora cf. gigantea A]
MTARRSERLKDKPLPSILDEPDPPITRVSTSKRSGPGMGKVPVGRRSRAFNAILSCESVAISREINILLERFTMDPHAASVDVLNLVLEGAGVPASFVSPMDVFGHPIDDSLDGMVASLDRRKVVLADKYPLYSADRRFKRFSDSFRRFWVT